MHWQIVHDACQAQTFYMYFFLELQHPKYKSGEWNEDRCLQEFLSTFEQDGDNSVSELFLFPMHYYS